MIVMGFAGDPVRFYNEMMFVTSQMLSTGMSIYNKFDLMLSKCGKCRGSYRCLVQFLLANHVLSGLTLFTEMNKGPGN